MRSDEQIALIQQCLRYVYEETRKICFDKDNDVGEGWVERVAGKLVVDDNAALTTEEKLSRDKHQG